MRARGGEALIDGGDEQLHLVVLEHRLADGARLNLPRFEERVLTGLRDRGGDGRQSVLSRQMLAPGFTVADELQSPNLRVDWQAPRSAGGEIIYDAIAEHMVDGDRAVVGDLARLRSAGGRERRRRGGQRQETPPGQRSRHPARVANSPENYRTTRRPGRALSGIRSAQIGGASPYVGAASLEAVRMSPRLS